MNEAIVRANQSIANRNIQTFMQEVEALDAQNVSKTLKYAHEQWQMADTTVLKFTVSGDTEEQLSLISKLLFAPYDRYPDFREWVFTALLKQTDRSHLLMFVLKNTTLVDKFFWLDFFLQKGVCAQTLYNDMANTKIADHQLNLAWWTVLASLPMDENTQSQPLYASLLAIKPKIVADLLQKPKALDEKAYLKLLKEILTGSNIMARIINTDQSSIIYTDQTKQQLQTHYHTLKLNVKASSTMMSTRNLQVLIKRICKHNISELSEPVIHRIHALLEKKADPSAFIVLRQPELFNKKQPSCLDLLKPLCMNHPHLAGITALCLCYCDPTKIKAEDYLNYTLKTKLWQGLITISKFDPNNKGAALLDKALKTDGTFKTILDTQTTYLKLKNVSSSRTQLQTEYETRSLETLRPSKPLPTD